MQSNYESSHKSAYETMKTVHSGLFSTLETAPDAFCRTLCEAGYTEDVAWRKTESLRRAVDAAKRAGLTTALANSVAIFVPGRVELWGKHTDYAGGDSITCATDQGFCALLVPDSMRERSASVHSSSPHPKSVEAVSAVSHTTEMESDSHVAISNVAVLRLHRLDTSETCTLPLVSNAIPAIDSQIERQPWMRYPWTVVRRLVKNFGEAFSAGGVSPEGRAFPAGGGDVRWQSEVRGGTLFFESDLPLAAGMSSSSAFMILIALALIERNQWWKSEEFTRNIPDLFALANYLASVENGSDFGTLAGERGVGTCGGSEDHTAILLSKRGFLRHYRYAPVRLIEEVAWPVGYRLVIGVSGVVAEKSGAVRERYNAAARLAAELGVWWRRLTGRMEDRHLGAAFESRSMMTQILSDGLREQPPTVLSDSERRRLLRRLEHFEVENIQSIPEAMSAFRAMEPRSDASKDSDASDGLKAPEDSDTSKDWRVDPLDVEAFWSDGMEERLGTVAFEKRLMTVAFRSQRAAEELLENQTPETSFLAASALRDFATARSKKYAADNVLDAMLSNHYTPESIPELRVKSAESKLSKLTESESGKYGESAFAIASSAFGAGFGGSVWAIVPEAAVAVFCERWLSDYRDRFPQYADTSTVLVTNVAPAAKIFVQSPSAA